mgnify:CR=1 FL=1
MCLQNMKTYQVRIVSKELICNKYLNIISRIGELIWVQLDWITQCKVAKYIGILQVEGVVIHICLIYFQRLSIVDVGVGYKWQHWSGYLFNKCCAIVLHDFLCFLDRRFIRSNMVGLKRIVGIHDNSSCNKSACLTAQAKAGMMVLLAQWS